MRYFGLTLENASNIRLLKKGELKPVLKDQNLIGKDGFREVYRGLVGGVQIVVRNLTSGPVLETEQFVNEVIIQS